MTNQRAELYAAVRALDVVLEKLCDNLGSVQIFTDRWAVALESSVSANC